MAPSSGAMAECVMAYSRSSCHCPKTPLRTLKKSRVPVNKGSCHRDDVESWLGLSTHFVRREFSVDAEPTLQFQMLA